MRVRVCGFEESVSVRSGLCVSQVHTQDAVIRDNFQASRLSQDYLRTLTFRHKGHET